MKDKEKKIKDKDKEKEKDKDKVKFKEKAKTKDKSKSKDKSKEKPKDKNKVKEKLKDKNKAKVKMPVKDADLRDWDFDDLSSSLEEYLEIAYKMIGSGQKARVTKIAQESGHTKPSVLRAINVLTEMGYLEHESYSDVTLTQKGMSAAKMICDRHELMYDFFRGVLKVSDEDIYTKAGQMSHFLSKEACQKLEEFVKHEV